MVKPAAAIDIINVPRDGRFWSQALLSFDTKKGNLVPAQRLTFATGYGLSYLRAPVCNFVERQAPTLDVPQMAQLSVNLAQLNTKLSEPIKHPLEYVKATPVQALQILQHELTLLHLAQFQRSVEAPRMDQETTDVDVFDKLARRIVAFDVESFNIYCVEITRICEQTYAVAERMPPDKASRRAVGNLLRTLRREAEWVQAAADKARGHRSQAALLFAELSTITADRFGEDADGNVKKVKLVPLRDGNETHAASLEDIETLQAFAAFLATVANETHKALDGPIMAQDRKLDKAGFPDWVSAATLLEGAIGALGLVAREQRVRAYRP